MLVTAIVQTQSYLFAGLSKLSMTFLILDCLASSSSLSCKTEKQTKNYSQSTHIASEMPSVILQGHLYYKNKVKTSGTSCSESGLI